VSVAFSGRQAIGGDAVAGEVCAAAAVALDAGTHRVEGIATSLPIEVDRVVLTETNSVPDPANVTATATVVDESRFHRTIEISGCPDGCWLVFGEGFNEAWEATGPDGSLGEPQLVDGGFNGWWIEGSQQPVEVTVEWTQQGGLTIAMGASLLGVAAAIVLLVLDLRRRRDPPQPDDSAAPARLTGTERDLPFREAVLVAIAWTALAGLLISPSWALAGLVAGVALIATRIRRLAELTAWSTVVAVGVMVTIRERRNAPAPGGGWPGVFESWHAVAMFATVCVLVSVLARSDRLEQDRHRLHGVVGEGDEAGIVAGVERLPATDQP
jgi:arabinofuranan 3-O-arabinosyltransferase